MKLIITTNDCLTSNGYNDSIKTAFCFANRWATNVTVKNKRIEAKKDGYPVRFVVLNFSVRDYRDLMYSKDKVYTCNLGALPVLPQKPEAV